MIHEIIKVTNEDAKRYLEYTFDVTPNTSLVSIEFDYDRMGGENVVDFALKTEDQFLGATGGAYQKIFLTNDNRTSFGYPIGLYPQYTIIFRIYKVFDDFEIKLTIDQQNEPKRNFNVDLHTHTICSDGKHTITEVDQYAQNQYLDVVGITDHFAMNAQRLLSDEFKTQMHLGFELTMQWGHMCIYNIPTHAVKYQFTSQPEVIDWLVDIKEKYNAFQIVNHPYGNCEDCDWKLGYDYDAIELLNSFDIDNNIKSLNLYQELLTDGKFLPATCGSDTHSPSWVKQGMSTHGFPTNQIFAKDKSLESLLEAISQFDNILTYYPQVQITSEFIDGQYHVENLPLGCELRVFTEAGQVENKNIQFDSFVRLEVWQDTSLFTKYITEKLGFCPTFNVDSVPIIVTNPLFRSEHVNFKTR